MDSKKPMYSPLVKLLSEEFPQAEDVLDVFKRASKKRISLDYPGFENQFHTLLRKANLSFIQLKELNSYMNRGTAYFEQRRERKDDEKIWGSLATYVYHNTAIEEAREKANSKKPAN